MQKIKHNNGRRHLPNIKERAIQLRKNGRTHREIVKELGVSLGSADLWTRGIILTEGQRESIALRRIQRIQAEFTVERRAILAKHARKFLVPYMKKRQHSNTTLLKRIKDFYKKNGRIPMKREFNSYRGFRLRFGSWNQAIIKAGFTPNPSSAKHYISRDGHMCDSLAERMIDDFLFEHDIEHLRSTPYAGYSKFKTDFLIGDVYIEYFGRVGLRDYDDIIRRKRDLCCRQNIRLIELYPNDILEKKKLPELLAEFIEVKK